MPEHQTDVRIHRLHPAGLDPITAYVEPYRPGVSRITVQCYAQAWTAFWGAHGADVTLEQFVASCNADYVAGNLAWGRNGLETKRAEARQRAYLHRIVAALQQYFREQGGSNP